MLQSPQAPESPMREAPGALNADRSRALRPTVYCPPPSVEACVRELRDPEAQ